MASIEINENSDGEVYTFLIKDEKTKAVEDLSGFTTAVMTILNKNGTTNYGSATTIAFGTKSAGEVTYTTDPADPYPSFGEGERVKHVIGQLKLTGTDRVTITRIIEIKLTRDLSTIS